MFRLNCITEIVGEVSDTVFEVFQFNAMSAGKMDLCEVVSKGVTF